MKDALRTYRIGTLGAFAAGGALALATVAARDGWPRGVLLCLMAAGAAALYLVLMLGWALEADITPAVDAVPPAELGDPRFPITATDPQLATELLLASLTTHPPRVVRGPAT